MANKQLPQPPIGAHLSISKGYDKAIDLAISIGANAIQVFAKSPMRAELKKITEEQERLVKENPDRDKIKFIVIHASYLLNLAKPLDLESYQLKSIIEDLENSEAIGGNGVILHLGKSLDMGLEKAKDNFVKNIKTVVKKTAKLKSKIMLEITAGQGSEVGHQIEELAEIYNKIDSREKVAICIDTAHAFAGGYDLRTPKTTDEFLNKIDKLIKIENVTCIHFNDSKKPLGSRVDRHQDIGKGTIGLLGLEYFFKEISKRSKNSAAFILETTEEFLSYQEQIEIIKRWT